MPLVRRRRFRKRRGDRTRVVAYSLVILLMLAIGAGGALVALLYAHQHGGWELASWTGLFHRAPVPSRLADAASGEFCRIGDPGTCSAEALATASCRGGDITLADATPLPTKPLAWRDADGTPLASAPKAGGNGAPDKHSETPADDLPPNLQDLVPTSGGPPGQANYWPGTPPTSPAGGPGGTPPGPNGFTPLMPPPNLTSRLPPGGGGPQSENNQPPGGPGTGDPTSFTPIDVNPPTGKLPTESVPTDGTPSKDGGVVAIAEPGTAALLIAGPAILAWIRLRRRRTRG